MDERILLLKTEKNYYTRKNSKYLTAKFFCTVNKNNQVNQYALWGKNGIYIISNECKNENIVNLISEKKLNQLKKDDRYILYCINKGVYLSESVLLDKKVHGLRYATPDESTSIINQIVYDMIIKNKITFKDIVYYNPNYTKVYTYCMEHGLEEGLYNNIQQGNLYKKKI